jgi:hypothetical protein
MGSNSTTTRVIIAHLHVRLEQNERPHPKEIAPEASEFLKRQWRYKEKLDGTKG